MTPPLRPSECARVIGMSPEFIRGEIKDGRLRARKYTTPRGRVVYRIDLAAFELYLETHWPERSTLSALNETLSDGDGTTSEHLRVSNNHRDASQTAEIHRLHKAEKR